MKKKDDGAREGYVFRLRLHQGVLDKKFESYGSVIFSFKELPPQVWEKRKPTGNEMNTAKAFQIKHVGKGYKDERLDDESLFYVLQTKMGNYMILPLIVDSSGEFYDALGLIIHEERPNIWNEYCLFDIVPNPEFDIDGDGFPEFYGGNKYDYGLFRQYPNHEILLQAGL